MNNTDNIIWINAEDVSVRKINLEKSRKYPKPICDLRTYSNLKEELLVKCEPKNYYGEKYNHDMVNSAIDLTDEIKRTDENDIPTLKRLRKSAIEKLEVKFVTKDLYEKLLKLTNPDDFDDIETKHIINDYHLKVLMAADNIEELELIKEDIINISNGTKYIDLFTILQSLDVDDVFLCQKEEIIKEMPLLDYEEIEKKIKILSESNKIYKELINFPIENYKIFHGNEVEHFRENINKNLSHHCLSEFEKEMNLMIEDTGIIVLIIFGMIVIIPVLLSIFGLL